MQKESLLFCSFLSDSNFSEGKVTEKREKCKRKACFSAHFRVTVTSPKEKLRKKTVTKDGFGRINAE